ncbi:MAG TPA: type II/IV secretion system ATPase subunit [Thermoplasmataceae archaeon]|nr:type II/IV secretion system ATPase subunit [Thermoplasmatales archaeon AK]HLH85919.1 type II/IV secretion system ATPase subunit [Thermoplasmataceae archaeon]
MVELLESYNIEVYGFQISVKIIQDGPFIRYEVEEPPLLESEAQMLAQIREEVLKRISDGSVETLVSEEGIRVLNETIGKRGLNEQVKYYIMRDLLYYGPITPFFWDQRVEDITCTSFQAPVTVFLKEYGYLQTNVSFRTEEEMISFSRRLAQFAGKQLSLANPIIDGNLPDGSRIQISLGGLIATKGTTFTIRRFRERPISFIDLCQLGTVTPEVLAFIWTCIEYGSNIIVVGGTAAGKTTFLNAILQFVPQNKKIVTIEDTREINIMHDNWLPMVTRTAPVQNQDQDSSIDMFMLLESALRHRPNYIIVGEVRGREAFTIFQALSAGRYGLATFHADDFESFLNRMESNPINLPRTLITTLDLVIVLSTRFGKYGLERKLNTVVEVVGLDPDTGEVITNDLYRRESDSYAYAGFSYVLEKIGNREGLTLEAIKDQMTKRERFIDLMMKKGISQYERISPEVDRFQHDQDASLSSLENQ